MPAAFKFGSHKKSYHFFGIPFAHKPRRNADDIGVVVRPGQLGKLFAPANCGPNTLVFIGGNGNPIGTSTYQNAKGRVPDLNSFCYGVRKVGIVDRVFGMCAKIAVRNSFSLKERNKVFFIIEASMIATNSNGLTFIEM